MAKTVLASKFTELKGLDRISTVVHEEMRCLFREITKDDVGIDGEIEVLVPKADGRGSETTGGFIKVQSKSGATYVKENTATSFSTPVEEGDLKYWYNVTYPVIFVVYHPDDDRLYWKDVRAYVRSTPQIWQRPFKIVFDKAVDIFSGVAADAILTLGNASPPRVSTQERERLFTNLLLVKRIPPVITSAVAKITDYRSIRAQIRGYKPPFCIIEDRLYTLADLRQKDCVLREVCEVAHVNDVLSKSWLADVTRRRDLIFLLNQLLGLHLRQCGINYNPDARRNYFPRQDDTRREFKQDWFSVRTGRNAPPRIIVKHYVYGADQFWRHLAAQLSFRYIGSSLYLQVVPKYFFTSDGETAYDRDKTGPYTTSLKASERNPHVLNHVLFWSDILSIRKPTIEIKLGARPVMAIEKLPVSGMANFAIPLDPATFEEEEDAGQSDFFSMLSSEVDDEELEEADDDLAD